MADSYIVVTGGMDSLMGGAGCTSQTPVSSGATMASGEKGMPQGQAQYFSGTTTSLWEHC